MEEQQDGLTLALYPRTELAKDANVALEPSNRLSWARNF